MARPLRIEFAGATYHVTARGDRQEQIFDDDIDRINLLSVFAQGASRFEAKALAFCLMNNHYHFVIETAKPNLSRLMRHVNGVYTQLYNRRHDKSGHLFQGRFKAILVDRDAYLLEVCRYVDLNPVRAGIVEAPHLWQWSSYLAITGKYTPPEWLETGAVLSALTGRAIQTRAGFRRAAQDYVAFVAEGKNVRLWETELKSQIYLGDARFVKRMLAKLPAKELKTREVPRAQRKAPQQGLSSYLNRRGDRDSGIVDAYLKGGHSMRAISEEVGLSVSQVSRIVRKVEFMQETDAT